MIDIAEILAKFNIYNVQVTPFKDEEDGSEYLVWKITQDNKDYVLKQAKGLEIDVYSTFFKDEKPYVPKYYGYVEENKEKYFLISYFEGKTLSKCDKDSLTKAIDALVDMQEEFWNKEEYFDLCLNIDNSFKEINLRKNHLESKILEKVYNDFIDVYLTMPKTLSHADLLPYNILIADKALLIDWEYGGMLPYLTSFSRLIAHTKDDKDYLFYMDEKDKEFAIQYYYDKLVKKHQISYEKYRHDLDYFIFFEYCEWIMLGNRYNQKDERFYYYLNKANELADKLLK